MGVSGQIPVVLHRFLHDFIANLDRLLQIFLHFSRDIPKHNS